MAYCVHDLWLFDFNVAGRFGILVNTYRSNSLPVILRYGQDSLLRPFFMSRLASVIDGHNIGELS